MQFSEHELTLAVTAAAQAVNGAQHRGIDPAQAWESLSRIERYHVLNAIGDQVLPALLALPEVEVEPGTRPTFSDAQISEAVKQTVGDAGGLLRRRATIAARASLLKVALAGLPVRHDPDSFVVPDFL